MKNKKLNSVLLYLGLFIIFIALFLFLQWFYSTRTESTYERPTSPVEVVTPQVRTLTKEITLSSYVCANSTIPVVPYLDGTILQYNVQEGDYVNEGDIIATIDPEPYELQRDQAMAAYLGYQSSFERVEKLYSNQSVSKQDYDTVKAQRDAYKAQLELAELQVSYTNVTAKTSGTILKTVASQGSTASKGTPIAIIADLSDLTVDLNLGEQYFALFSQAYNNGNTSNYKITVTRPASQYSQEVSTTASIKAVSPYVDATSRNFKIYLKLDDPTFFNPGMYVKVTIAIETQTGYSIERKAMKLDGGAYYVQVSNDNTTGIGSNTSTDNSSGSGDNTGDKSNTNDVANSNANVTYTAQRIDLSNAFTTSEYVIIPEKYKDEKFIIKGQNDLFAGQAVNIVEEN